MANKRFVYNSLENNDRLIAVTVQLPNYSPLHIVLNISFDVDVRIKALVAQGWE